MGFIARASKESAVAEDSKKSPVAAASKETTVAGDSGAAPKAIPPPTLALGEEKKWIKKRKRQLARLVKTKVATFFEHAVF